MSELMPLSCDEARELAALAALDVLDATSRAQLEQHLADCDACRVATADLLQVVAALAYAAPPRMPRAQAKTRLMARVRGEEAAPPQATAVVAPPRPAKVVTPAPVPLPRTRERVLAFASVALAVGLLMAGLHIADLNATVTNDQQRIATSDQRLASTQKDMQRLQSASSLLEGQLGAMQASLSSTAADADLLASKDVRMVAMNSPKMHSAQAWVYWSPERHAWLATFRGLPKPGPTKTYQLWAVTAGKPVSLGTFAADQKGVAHVHVSLPDGGKPVAAAVSLEPAGGRPTPTGPIVMMGPIKQL